MLLGFKVKNYKSFDELTHFSMIAGRTRNFENHIIHKNNLEILKFSALYGANASGKTNFTKAISYGKNLVLFGMDGISPSEYFRVKEKNSKLPSYFEYEIEKEGKLYSYGFEINILSGIITSEWLIDMTKKTPTTIFERDAVNHKITSNIKFKNKKASAPLLSCMKEMENNNNIFFLNELSRRLLMAGNPEAELVDFVNVFDFFVNDLQIIGQNEGIKYNYLTKNKDNIIELLSKLGIDISKIEEVDSSLDEIKSKVGEFNYNSFIRNLNFLKNNTSKTGEAIRIRDSIYIIRFDKTHTDVKALKIKHSYSDTYFDTFEESAGTLRILELIDVLLAENKVFIIDEIDRCLHPSLTTKFIETFLESKNKNVQLIITSHETKLLTFDTLRRDEVWFTEKGKNGDTILYSLEQFKSDARFDRKIDKAYLEGRYGAIPIFDINEKKD